MSVSEENKFTIIRETHRLQNGRKLSTIKLSNGFLSVTVTNVGACVMAIELPDRDGIIDNVVAAYDDINNYFDNRFYLGCSIGRYANRIESAQFRMDGRIFSLSRNENCHHLHGGLAGFHTKEWNIEAITKDHGRAAVVMTYLSKEGEEGYPGNLRAAVSYELDSKNCFSISYQATTDKKSPVNLTNHSYFNLAGVSCSKITNHLLQINASSYTQKNGQHIPTGEILLLKDTPLDFSCLSRIGNNMELFEDDQGYNHNYVLAVSENSELNYAATLIDPFSGRFLKIATNQPGLQLYTANFWDNSPGKKGGGNFCQHGAVALEPQAFPDSVNHPNFPNTILEPGNVYLASTTYEFGIRHFP